MRTQILRIRRLLAWSGLAIIVLAIPLWIVSGWYSFIFKFKFIDRYAGIGVFCGVARLELGIRTSNWTPKDPRIVAYVGRHWGDQAPVYFWKVRHGRLVGAPCVDVPLWLPLMFIAPSTALLFLTGRRAAPGSCPRCSYSRTGLDPAAPCPECGATSTPRRSDSEST